tara:strand:+ start:6041 stop:6397 length:357 start_codon:yes stop_codon:yes gene_type:complete
MNLTTITFSAYNTFKKAFEALFEPKPLDAMTDSDIENIRDNATSATAWVSNEADVPEAVTEMNAVKTLLEWKGEITVTPYTSTKNGSERSGYSINAQREQSRRIGLTAFRERLAGLVR